MRCVDASVEREGEGVGLFTFGLILSGLGEGSG